MRIPERVFQILPPQIDIINARAAGWRERGADVVSLGQALPGFPPPAIALAAVRSALSAPDTHIYSSDAGILDLRTALCQQLAKQYQADVNPNTEMIITAGANQAFLLALLTLLEQGDEVILPSPYFMNHEMAVRSVGAVPVEAPLNEAKGFSLNFADIEPYITKKTRAVVIVSPCNPTGAVYDPEELKILARALLGRGIYPIADETYMQFVYDSARHYSLASLPEWRAGVLVVGSFSKSYAMTGWRVGYLIAPEDFIREALKIQDTMLICAPVISQQAVLAAVSQAWDYPVQFLNELNARRLYIFNWLKNIPALKWHPTQGGFFAFVRVKECLDAQELANRILDKVHVVVIPGNLFGRAGEGFLRLSYGSVNLVDLEKACIRLAGFFKEYNTNGAHSEGLQL